MIHSHEAFWCLTLLEMMAVVSIPSVLVMQGAIKNIDLDFDSW
jgi:hypothetical protein